MQRGQSSVTDHWRCRADIQSSVGGKQASADGNFLEEVAEARGETGRGRGNGAVCVDGSQLKMIVVGLSPSAVVLPGWTCAKGMNSG